MDSRKVRDPARPPNNLISKTFNPRIDSGHASYREWVRMRKLGHKVIIFSGCSIHVLKDDISQHERVVPVLHRLRPRES